MTITWADTVQAETVAWNNTNEHGIALKQLKRTVAKQNKAIPKTAISEKKQYQERITSCTTKQHKLMKIKKSKEKKKCTNSNDCPGDKQSAGTME
eukprot:1192443-Prorocentrum_minimum.AAC.1